MFQVINGKMMLCLTVGTNDFDACYGSDLEFLAKKHYAKALKEVQAKGFTLALLPPTLERLESILDTYLALKGNIVSTRHKLSRKICNDNIDHFLREAFSFKDSRKLEDFLDEFPTDHDRVVKYMHMTEILGCSSIDFPNRAVSDLQKHDGNNELTVEVLAQVMINHKLLLPTKKTAFLESPLADQVFDSVKRQFNRYISIAIRLDD